MDNLLIVVSFLLYRYLYYYLKDNLYKSASFVIFVIINTYKQPAWNEFLIRIPRANLLNTQNFN